MTDNAPPDATAVGDGNDTPPTGAASARTGAQGGHPASMAGPSGQDRPAPTRLSQLDLWETAGQAPGEVDIDKQREDVREYLAKRLLLLVAGTLVIGAVLMATRRWTQISDDDLQLFFQVGFTAVIALVSAAVGFYFGNSSNGHSRGGS